MGVRLMLQPCKTVFAMETTTASLGVVAVLSLWEYVKGLNLVQA